MTFTALTVGIADSVKQRARPVSRGAKPNTS